MPGHRASSGDSRRRPRPGTVYLVGAGPGDPGLLTVQAARLLRRADTVIHDALIGPRILQLVPPAAQLIDVGKRCGGKSTTQECINDVLIEAASKARVVVRLKGGDPFVFGRGGEEALALADAGVRFRVVPGVTAGVGVSAYAGIPVTHRDLSSSVTFVTGHEKEGADPKVDWDAIGRVDGTVVVYMALRNLAEITSRLIGGGRDQATPAAVVEWGTVARQRTVTGRLDNIAEAAAEGGIEAPALLVVGEVAALRDRLAWFDTLPLRGKRIVVARSRPQPSRLSRAFDRLGADVVEYPTLRSRPTTLEENDGEAFAALGSFSWVLFSSPAGVRYFWDELARRGLDGRALAGAKIAAFGLTTTSALNRRGIRPDVSARSFEVESVAAALGGSAPLAGARILFPRERGRFSAIVQELRERGADLDELPVFETYFDPFAAEVELDTADFAVLPSSSAANTFARGLGGRSFAGKVVAIGPATAQAALTAGLQVDAIPDDHTVRGVVGVVRGMVGSASSPRDSASSSRDSASSPRDSASSSRDSASSSRRKPGSRVAERTSAVASDEG